MLVSHDAKPPFASSTTGFDSRKIEDVVEEAFTVAPEAKVLVIEGNYLLLGDPPWGAVKPTVRSCSLYRRAREKVQNRLMKRHAEEGLFSEERNPNISTAWTCRTMILLRDPNQTPGRSRHQSRHRALTRFTSRNGKNRNLRRAGESQGLREPSSKTCSKLRSTKRRCRPNFR